LLDTWKVLGMRGTGSQDIELDRVFVPDDATKGVRCPVGKWHPFMHAVVLVALPVFYSAYLESPRPRGTWRSASAALCRRTILVNAAIAAVQKAMEVAGGAGFFRSRGLERAFRDIQAARYHPVPEKPQTRMTGRVMLGLDIDG
jgi:acyl-CoA dehydrogenase